MSVKAVNSKFMSSWSVTQSLFLSKPLRDNLPMHSAHFSQVIDNNSS